MHEIVRKAAEALEKTIDGMVSKSMLIEILKATKEKVVREAIEAYQAALQTKKRLTPTLKL